MQQSDFLHARNHSTIAITTIEGPLTDINIINNTVNKIQVSTHSTVHCPIKKLISILCLV
jgi:hypothetical protein